MNGAAALMLGAASIFAPLVAILGLGALGARVLMQGVRTSFDWRAAIGPILAALIVGAWVGLQGAIGVIFVWRLIADTRWSVGIATRLATAAGRPAETKLQALAHAWLTPIFGVTLVAYTAPHMIAGLPLDLPHVPLWVPLTVGALAFGALIDWALRCAADWRLNELAAAPAAHLLTHHVIFLIAFGTALDVSAGVVMLIAWRLLHAMPAPANA